MLTTGNTKCYVLRTFSHRKLSVDSKTSFDRPTKIAMVSMSMSTASDGMLQWYLRLEWMSLVMFQKSECDDVQF